MYYIASRIDNLPKRVYYSKKYKMWLCDEKYAEKYKSREKLIEAMQGYLPDIEERHD